jgi:transcriptional regulator with XRE-family HTH domain
MNHGYSQNLVAANKRLDAKSLGVALGRMCIEHGIPVSKVAEVLGVSRMAVYNWFLGASTPNRTRTEQIELFITLITSHKKRK